MVRRFAILTVWLAAAPALAHMGMGPDPGAPPADKPAEEQQLPDVDRSIAGDPQKVWEAAERAFADHDWLDAIAHYQHIRTKFPYNVALATNAELRLADVAFAREKWSEARTAYRNFLRFHPRHEKADYAAFRVGLSAYKDIPGDNLVSPPAIERDMADVRDALQQMRRFQREWPQSQYVPEAKIVIRECEDRLAAHELYVAKFYAKRDKWRGVVLRANTLVNTYPESTLASEALLLEVEAHAALGEPEKAKEAYERLAARQPPKELLERGRAAAGIK